MSQNEPYGPCPDDKADVEHRLHQIRAFWEELYIGEDPGETTWEELGVYRDQVNGALEREPPDVTRAESLTAYVAFLLTGQTNL